MSDEANNLDSLRISATAHGANYLPEYYAQDRGLFAQVGLSVTAKACNPWDGVLDDLESGEAEIALGGLWVPAMYAGARDLVAFGQLNARFPMVVLTRQPVEQFHWSWLSGRTVLAPGIGGTAPYEFTAGLIREAGVQLSGTRFSRDLPGGMLTDLWRAGLGDAFITDLLTAGTLVGEGLGHVTYRLAQGGGVMPNSVYYVKRERLEELAEPLSRFMSALGSAMRTLSGAEDLDFALAVAARHWPEAPAAVLEEAVRDLATNGTWSSSAVDPDAAARWIRMLDEAGLLLSEVSVSDIWDCSVTDSASVA